MATAQSTRVAPATSRPGLLAALRRLLPAALTAVVVAVVMQLVYDPWYLNYDARYALVWAQDLTNGFLPEYKADYAPTPRPFQTVLALIATPFGDAADNVMTWFALLALGILAWLTFRLGAKLFSPWAGAIAALVVVTRPVIERDALLGYQDLPFAALVVGAVLLEAHRPRRGLPVLAVLAVAGLIRPEAWVLAGLYVLYLWRDATPRQRAIYVALAATAPVIWSLTDLIVTGDPLHSMHGTADLAEENERRRHLSDVPRWSVQYVAYTLREPLLIGVPIGLFFAWRHRRREAVLPLVVAAAMLAVFAAGPIFGLPLIGRYVRTPATLLTLFYGLAVIGWMLLPRGQERTIWTVVGVGCALLSVAFLPKHAELLDGLDLRFERDGALYGGLYDAAQAPEVRAAFAACQPLSVGDHRPVPYMRNWLDGKPGSVGTVEGDLSPLGRVLLVPRDKKMTRRFYREEFPRVRPPASYETIYQNQAWRVYAAPGC
jgi:hypothetical protein